MVESISEVWNQRGDYSRLFATIPNFSPPFPTVGHYSYSTIRYSGFPDTRVLFCCSCELNIADIHLASLADSLKVRHAFLPHVGEERVKNPKRVCEGG